MTAAALSFIPTREITIGALAVMTDYAGREIGVRVTHIHEDGSVTGRHCGLAATAPYQIGDAISRDRKHVRPAF
jgi:hypothetical protein